MIEERDQGAAKRRRVLDVRQVAAARQDQHLGVGELGGGPTGLGDRNDPVLVAPDQQHRHPALSAGADLVAECGQSGAQEPGPPRQPVLLDQPPGPDPPRTPEQRQTLAPGAQGGPGRGPATGDPRVPSGGSLSIASAGLTS